MPDSFTHFARWRAAALAAAFWICGATAGAKTEPTFPDVPFAAAGATELRLDLYLPEGDAAVGLVVWVHGGAWRAGDRSSVDILALRERGWAIASVDYRLSPVAAFPAQVHDIKAAIRFLRARAGEYRLPADRFAIAGSSAGGHLAALVGASNGHPELEGEVGEFLDTSSDVQAIVSLYGASNLASILAQSTPHGLSVRRPALELFLGGQPEDLPEVARLASPVYHVDRSDPPLLLFHGDQDPQMPINQSHELRGAYERLGLVSRFIVKHGAAHGGPAFVNEESIAQIDSFLRETFAVPGE